MASKSTEATSQGFVDLVRSYIFGEDDPKAPKPKFKIIDDGKDYDFTSNRTSPKRTNLAETVANLVKGCLGAGIMGIHEAFMKAGIWAGFFSCFFFAFYIYHCGYILVKSSQILYKRLHLPCMSYPDVAEAAMEVGPKRFRRYSKCFRHAIDIVIMIELFGACTVYVIVIGKTIKQLAEGEHETKDINILRCYIAGLFIPVIALGMVTTLKYIARFSMLGNLLLFVCVCTTVYYGVKDGSPLSDRPALKSVLGFFEFCGVAAFSMQCIAIALSVENVMKKPKQFSIALKIAYIIILIFVTTTGFFGYLGFGERCRSPIHLNFPRETYPLVLKFMMAIMIYVTFAINFYTPFNFAWFYIQKKYKREHHKYWERVYRFFIIIGIFCVALAFPNMGNLMGLLGAFCITLVVFVFPPIIQLLVVWDNPGLGRLNYLLWKNMLIIIIGLNLLVLGVYTNGKELISKLGTES